MATLKEVVEKFYDSKALSVGDIVVMAGYPYENDQIFMDTNASVLTLAGRKNPIPGMEKTLEIGGVVERGMSGGPMLAADGTLHALISHQYLQAVAGGQTYVETFGTNTLTIANHLIVLPFKSLIPWITDAVVKSEANVAEMGVHKDPYAQLLDKDVVTIGNLKIAFLPAKDVRPRVSPGAGDGVGAGGKQV